MAKCHKKSGLAAWIEASIVLPDTVADSGPVNLWPIVRQALRQSRSHVTERPSLLAARRWMQN